MCNHFKSILGSFVIITTVLSMGCSRSDRSGIDPTVEHKASPLIADSFAIADSASDSNDLAIDHAHIEIKKSALGKEFLFSSNLLSQAPTPMFSTLQSRVVSFLFKDHSVYLVDVTKNFSVGTDNIPQNLLIAQFEILQDKADSLVIDFNGGMKRIFTAGDMFSSDDPSFNGAEFKLPLAKVNLSYLDEVAMHGDAVFIRQVAQLESINAKLEVTAQDVEVRYQIKPYLPDPTFIPVVSPGFDKVGFFEANPLLLKDGTTRVYSMKWHNDKPIVFAISANTPEKYRDMVRSGILYWNKILGENKLQVIQLTDKSITAPSFNYNIIQWADYDAAGYAFADAHVDPRSGEVTAAQIFLPTAFTNANVPKRIRLTAGAGTTSTKLAVGLQGFQTARVCARNIYKDLADIDLNSITPEAMDKAMRDYVYEVIAHEMGHVLGLRHNFAGNLIANYDFKDRPALILNYYKNMKAPEGIVDSSSVMEYSRFEESAWNGDMLQRPHAPALIYDDMAIRALYFGEKVPETGRPPFCSDNHIGVYADCNMSDAGRSVISSAIGTYQFNLDSMAARLINIYISQSKLADDVGQLLKPVSEVNLNAKKQVETLGVDLAKFVALLKADTKFIAVRSPRLPLPNPFNPEMEATEKTYLQSEVNRLGGLETVLAPVSKTYHEQLIKRFSELLEEPYYNSGVRLDGSIYTFSATEKENMLQQVTLFAKQFENELILNELKAFSGENFSFEASYGQSAPDEKLKWADSDLTSDFAKLLLVRFNDYAFATTGEKIAAEIASGDGTKVKVELPVYYYPTPIRLAATNLFSNPGASIDWGYIEKKKAGEKAGEELKVLGDLDKLDKASLSKEALKWFLYNKKIQSTLTE